MTDATGKRISVKAECSLSRPLGPIMARAAAKSYLLRRDHTLTTTMPLQIVSHPDYDAEFPADHRFPMGKYRALRAALERRGLFGNGSLHQPQPASAELLSRAHEATYVEQVIACSVPYAIEREIGFAVGDRVARRARLASAGTLLAAELALEYGIACNTAGGSHHARRG